MDAFYFSPFYAYDRARARGCLTCTHFLGRFYAEHLLCERDGAAAMWSACRRKCVRSGKGRQVLTMNNASRRGREMKDSLFVLFLFLAGCASNSGVVPIGKDTYMVSRQAASGFSGSSNLKAEAFRDANEYCASFHKSFQVVRTNEGSGRCLLGNFPKAEIQFMCLDEKDAELARPKLRKDADTVIEIKK
jgi:hypothetical protein